MNLRPVIVTATLAACGLAGASRAQDYSLTVFPSPPVTVDGVEVTPRLDDDQLDQLLGPIALYPDSLLAQILPASTYPSDVALAAWWLKARPAPSDQAIDEQPWEPPVKALAHYPTIIQMMSDHPDWTEMLGATFLNQQEDVIVSIQRLRQQAIDAGALETTAEQQVVAEDNAIQILPASPDVLYVPEYDPQVVYVRVVERRSPLIVFRTKWVIGAWLNNCFDWHRHWVAVGVGWHHGWRYEDHLWHPAERYVVVSRAGNIVRFARIAGVTVSLTRPWSHNRQRPRPVLPPPVIVRGEPARGPSPRASIHAKPFSLPRPIVRIAEPRAPERPVPTPFGNRESRADVERAVRRAQETRSAWSRLSPARREPTSPAPEPVRPIVRPAPARAETPRPAPTRVETLRPVVAPAPAATPTRTPAVPKRTETPRPAVAPTRRAPGTSAAAAPSAFGKHGTPDETNAQSKRGHQSLRR